MSEELLQVLKNNGWNIKKSFIEENFMKNESEYESLKHIEEKLLNIDLKESGTSYLFENGIKGEVLPPAVLQIVDVRNISAPKANEESTSAPRMLRITLTDSKSYITILEDEYVKHLSLVTPPGTKVKLKSKLSSVSGYYLVGPKDLSILGGKVTNLYEKWIMSRNVGMYARGGVTCSDDYGPPKWVPFGKAIISNMEKEKDFKALNNSPTKEKDGAFESSRKETVMKLNQEMTGKVFGGGKQMLDSNIKKVVDVGFTIEEAEYALKRCRGDISRAIRSLKNPEEIQKTHDRGRGRRGRGRTKKSIAGPDGSDDEYFAPPSAKPSGPASLADFLEQKIPTKEPEPVQNMNYGGRNYRGMQRNRYNDDNADRSAQNPSSHWPVVGEKPDVSVNNSPNPNLDYNHSNYGSNSPRYENSKHNYARYENNQNNYGRYDNSHNNYRKYDNIQNNYGRYDNSQNGGRGRQHSDRRGKRGGGRAYRQTYQSNDSYGYRNNLEYKNSPSYSNQGNFRPKQEYNQASNYNQRGGQSRAYSEQETNLVAQFQQSMVLMGHYDPTDMNQSNRSPSTSYGEAQQSDYGQNRHRGVYYSRRGRGGRSRGY